MHSNLSKVARFKCPFWPLLEDAFDLSRNAYKKWPFVIVAAAATNLWGLRVFVCKFEYVAFMWAVFLDFCHEKGNIQNISPALWLSSCQIRIQVLMQSKFNLAKELAISHSAASSKVAICRECAMGLTTLAEFFFLFGRGLYAILPKSQTIGCLGYAFQSRNI